MQGVYPLGAVDGVVPGSDGAGEIVKAGSKVIRWKIGDKVLTTYIGPDIGGSLSAEKLKHGTGGRSDGIFAEFGAFNEYHLVAMPKSLAYEEASTSPVAGLTAWNALYGLEGKKLRAGDYVLTEGSGGTSVFALQVSCDSHPLGGVPS
jgi:NADPH:quinone reductase-like Zn-dependent oxidoreductase